MKYVLFILVFLISCPLLAQDQFLEMSKTGTDKVRTFKENKRVKVKTIKGEKYIGRFHIVDNTAIEIEGNMIPLSSISNIKSRSVIAGIAGTFLIVYGALLVLSSPIAGGLVGADLGYSFFGSGAVFTLSGIFFNEFARNQRSDKWTYKIIEE